MTESFPLQWPEGRERTNLYLRKDAKFDTTPAKARNELLRELKRLGASNVVISTNVATYERKGKKILYANQTASVNDPGVALYYTWKGEQYALACDMWKTVTDNLQSLNKTINAIRGIERWGTGEMMKAAFKGFKALPKEPPKAKTCWEILELNPLSTKEQIRQVYREKAKKAHPDAGGTTQAFNELQSAYNQALKTAV